MISVILYGRNDNYGYNLHKRAALSINCIAEVLSGETDEIVFVDYNTPDELPTFPEAIADTLTANARQRLRVLRVRPYIHERYKSRTHLAALEPIARNAGVRRSNSSNRWVLSTNTDLVFVSKRRQPLTDVVRGLRGGLYHAPRIEIPEVLWESLERNNPRAAIQSIRDWGWALHLNEIVYGNEIILYDGPGDFQLLERQRLVEIHGFNEDMLLGWHVDSNLAKRMELLAGKVRDLGNEVYAYHCDHTRQATPMHSYVRIENDWQRFVRDVVRADIPQQAESWGCAQDEIEEIRLTSGLAQAHICGLKHAIGPRLRQPLVAHYTDGSFDAESYDARHVVPFLIDLLCSYPKNTVIGWHGARIDTLRIFARAWNSLGFERPILVDNSFVDLASFATVLDTRLVPADAVRERATVFVLDFGKTERLRSDAAEGHEQKAVAQRLLDIVATERRRFVEGGPLRKIVTIGAINNEYETLVARHVAAGYVPFSTRIRQGYILLPFQGEQNWLPALKPGEAGIRSGRFIGSRKTAVGLVAFGPYKHLPPGKYQLNIDIGLDEADQPRLPADDPCLLIELRASFNLFAADALSVDDLKSPRRFIFTVPEAIGEDLKTAIEVRVITVRPLAFVIRKLNIEAIQSAEIADSVLTITSWLPFLRLGPAGRCEDGTVAAERGHEGYVVFGPYWPLNPGRYELVATIDMLQPEQAFPDDISLGVVDIAVNTDQLTKAEIRPDHLAKGGIRLAFEVPPAAADGVPPLVETRVWTSGHVGLLIRAMNVRKRITAEDDSDLTEPADVAAAAQPHSRTGTAFTKCADMPTDPDTSAWRDNPFSLLAQKWHEVPATHEDRFSTKNLLMLSDDELLAAWNQRAAQVRGAKGIHVGDWEVYVYADLFKGRKVIEVGPGLGVLGISFLERGAKMTFVDVVESNLKMIERVCRIKKLENVKFLHLKQFDDLQQLDTDYDAIFAHGSLHHAPTEVIKPEFTALASRLKVGGRFIMLTYPKSRWQNEGSPDFSQWGKSTDGEATPWAEWYDVPKLLKQLMPCRFHVLMTFDNIANGDMNWFDLVRTDGDSLFDEPQPQNCEPLSGAVQAHDLASRPNWTGSSVTRSDDGVTVQTGPARWGYAAEVQIAGLLPIGPGWLSVDLQVDRGIVGVGVPEKGGEQFLCERQFGDGATLPSLTMPVFIRIPDLSCAEAVIVRNAAVDGASKVLIRSMNILKQL